MALDQDHPDQDDQHQREQDLHGDRANSLGDRCEQGGFLGSGAEYARGVKVREQYPSFRTAFSQVRVAHLRYEHFCSQ